MTPKKHDGHMFTKVWSDPEIGGRFYLQACSFELMAILGPQGEKAMDRLFSVMHKLTAMRYHLEQYARFQAKLTLEYTLAFQINPNHNSESFDLICHFEAFMFQFKSSLDMLIKLARYVPAMRTFNTEAYRKSGTTLMNELRNAATPLLRRNPEDQLARTLEALASLVATAKSEWIEEAVQLRGELIHLQGARHFVFLPMPNSDGKIIAVPPRFKEKPVLARMEELYRRTLEYEQDFMAYTVAVAAPHLSLSPANPSMAQTFGPQYASFIKWGWNFAPGERAVGVVTIPDP